MSVDLPEPKVGHVGVTAPPFGPMVYVVVRHDGALIDVHPTRHDAAWTMERCHDANDFDVAHVPAGSVPLMDLKLPFGGEDA